jgi:hypothetical protein
MYRDKTVIITLGFGIKLYRNQLDATADGFWKHALFLMCKGM